MPRSSNCCSVSAADSVALIRERADTFISYAADPDPSCMRRAAIEGLGLFLDDIDKVMGILRNRLSAENGITERPLIVQTTADLVLHLRPRVPRRHR